MPTTFYPKHPALLVATAMALATLAPRAAVAEDVPSKIVEKVEPAKAPPPAPAPTEQAKTAFDTGGLSAIDPVTVKAIAALDEACVASPMSREGMSHDEEVRCNLAMAKISARGKVGASAVFAALNDPNAAHPYYARSQLYAALGKIDDEKIRGVVVAGLQKIATEELSDYEQDLYQLDETLNAMFATSPDADVPWDAKPVPDDWEGARANSRAWLAVQSKWAGKKRNEILITRLTTAKKDKTSADPKVAYQAIAYLVRHTPRTAKASAHTYAARDELAAEVRSGFEDLEQEAEFRLTEPNAFERM